MQSEYNLKWAYNEIVKVCEPRYGQRESKQIARILLEDKFEIEWKDLAKNPYRKLDTDIIRQLPDILTRLGAGEPVQYIVGYSMFYDCKIKVNPSVLIPRPETEELLDWVIKDCQNQGKNISILDIGTGSGCIAVALKKFFPDANVYALDISIDALALAHENALENNCNVQFIQGDVLEQGTWEHLPPCDIIISNPPYISPDERISMKSHVLDFEPELALFVPVKDALIFYKKIISEAENNSRVESCYFEVPESGRNRIDRQIDKELWSEILWRKDLQGKTRMLKIRKAIKKPA